MSYQKRVPRTENRLWRARKRRGFEQKQVAYLLDLSRDKISRYEKGMRLPNLTTVLGLQIIYGLPPHVLFKELFEKLRADIAARVTKRRPCVTIYADLLKDADERPDWCSYAELLTKPTLLGTDKDRIRTHVVGLVRQLSDK